MSKIQILCNNNNKIQNKSLKNCWERINLNTKRLIDLEKMKQELVQDITISRKENKNTAIQMVKLGRIIKEIKFYQLMNQIVYVWLKESRNKLVIC